MDTMVSWFSLAAYEFVGFRNTDCFRHSGKIFKVFGLYRAAVSGYPDRSPLLSGDNVRFEAECLNAFANTGDFRGPRLGLHDNEHG